MFLFILCKFPWHIHNNIKTRFYQVRFTIVTRKARVSYQSGGSSGNRTSDTRIFSPLLYRLSYEAKWRSRRELNPRSSAWQADVLTPALRDQNGCGNRIWTYDLWVMSPTSYRTAPSRDIDGGGKGIRTPAPLARPPGFQDRSLQPDLGIPPWKILKLKNKMVPKAGLEPARGMNLAGF